MVSFVVGALIMFGIMTFIDNQNSERFEENLEKIKQEKKDIIKELKATKDSLSDLNGEYESWKDLVKDKTNKIDENFDKLESNENKEDSIHNDVYGANERVLDSTIRTYKYPVRD